MASIELKNSLVKFETIINEYSYSNRLEMYGVLT